MHWFAAAVAAVAAAITASGVAVAKCLPTNTICSFSIDIIRFFLNMGFGLISVNKRGLVCEVMQEEFRKWKLYCNKMLQD